jgi:hypothetical protein
MDGKLEIVLFISVVAQQIPESQKINCLTREKKSTHIFRNYFFFLLMAKIIEIFLFFPDYMMGYEEKGIIVYV